jgi:hypothetical protein
MVSLCTTCFHTKIFRIFTRFTHLCIFIFPINPTKITIIFRYSVTRLEFVMRRVYFLRSRNCFFRYCLVELLAIKGQTCSCVGCSWAYTAHCRAADAMLVRVSDTTRHGTARHDTTQHVVNFRISTQNRTMSWKLWVPGVPYFLSSDSFLMSFSFIRKS